MIPVDCLYAEAVRAVSVYYAEHPENWRGCLDFIRENWGSERFSGAFHVIPNAAIMALAMLYGVGNFDKTLCIKRQFTRYKCNIKFPRLTKNEVTPKS